MFPIRDKTRRTICRTVFLTVGAIPMLGAIAWATVVNSGTHQSTVRDRLTASLGLEVRLANVSYPRPGFMRLSGLELADPETGETVASVRSVDIGDDENGQTIILSQPEINAAQSRRLWTLIDKRLRERFDTTSKTVRMTAGELTLRWTGGGQTLTDCSAQLESTADGNSIQAAFHLANIVSTESLELQISRTNRAGQPSTAVQLNAESAPVPCPLILAMLGRENHLGPQCMMRGKLQAFETPDGWQTEFAGRLDNIDLNAVVTDQFPHQLSGTAQLTVNKAVVHAGRLEQCDAEFQAGPGVISPSLLSAAAETLGMKRGYAEKFQAGFAGGVASYDGLAAKLRLDATGVLIHGCAGGETCIVARCKEGILLAESTDGPVPVVNLVRMLVPDSRVLVPATRQTDWLLHVLPVPDVAPHDAQSPPQARLRGPDVGFRR